MLLYGPPIAFTLFLWWFGTGLIFVLDGFPARTYHRTMAGATVLLGVGLVGLVLVGADTSVAGAFASFTCGLLVWAWQEVGFLMGNVTGPRKHACAVGCSGWAHFVHAVQAVLFHELALLVSAGVVVAISWGGANQVGCWTFIILWVMRTSAKLNVFLGVRNLSLELLPEHLQFLRSFLTCKPMNPLFPVSVGLGTLVTVMLVEQATAVGVSAFSATANSFLATMLALAVLEHWFLVLPLPVNVLWRWSLAGRRTAAPSLVTSITGGIP